MNQNNIKHLSLDAARLLLVLLAWDGTERIGDLPAYAPQTLKLGTL